MPPHRLWQLYLWLWHKSTTFFRILRAWQLHGKTVYDLKTFPWISKRICQWGKKNGLTKNFFLSNHNNVAFEQLSRHIFLVRQEIWQCFQKRAAAASAAVVLRAFASRSLLPSSTQQLGRQSWSHRPSGGNSSSRKTQVCWENSSTETQAVPCLTSPRSPESVKHWVWLRGGS